MKKILITGGAGFIGSAIVDRLSAEGHRIFVIDNLSFGNREFIEKVDDSSFFNLDILNRSGVMDCLLQVKPDIVLHLAAIHFIPYCNAHPFESSRVNLQGTLNVLDACKAAGSVEKLFFASTAAVYPVVNEAIPESTVRDPLDIYGLSKSNGEDLVRLFQLETGIPSVVCRFFNAFGPNETNPHLIPEIQKQVNSGARSLTLGNLTPKRDYIHTYDMARAVSLLLEKFNKGFDVFNLGSGMEYSVKEIVEAFEKVLGYSLEIQADPLRMRKSDRPHLLAEITKIKSFINWQPEIMIEEGIATLIDEKILNGR